MYVAATEGTLVVFNEGRIDGSVLGSRLGEGDEINVGRFEEVTEGLKEGKFVEPLMLGALVTWTLLEFEPMTVGEKEGYAPSEEIGLTEGE